MNPSPEKSSLRLWLQGVLVFLATMMILTVAGVWWAIAHFEAPGPLKQMTTVIVPKGESFNDIAELLEKNEVVDFPKLFQVMVVLQGNGRNFKAGEYEFHPAVSPRAVMDAMLEGRTVIRRMTIPEGFTSREISELLKQNPVLEGEVPWEIPEGTLLPETYHYSYGDSRAGIIERARTAMRNALERLWEQRDRSIPLKTPEEAIILASIVEKETGVAAERGRIAAVFINRLRKGMKLQADPTVIYGITEGSKKMGRQLSGSDLKKASDYNTYIITGLPPGPICNPGLDAIKAVLRPPKTSELYFVADGRGGHNFAATLKEHNANVNRYRAALKAQSN